MWSLVCVSLALPTSAVLEQHFQGLYLTLTLLVFQPKQQLAKSVRLQIDPDLLFGNKITHFISLVGRTQLHKSPIKLYIYIYIEFSDSGH